MKKERTFVNPFKLFFGASENYNQLSQTDAIDASNLSAEEKAELKKALKEVEKFEKEMNKTIEQVKHKNTKVQSAKYKKDTAINRNKGKEIEKEREGETMFEKFLKRANWTDIVISILFALLGILLIAKPEEMKSVISILLGIVLFAMGFLKMLDYFTSKDKEDYLLTIALVSVVLGVISLFCADLITDMFRALLGIWIIVSGVRNFQTTLVWKDVKSKLWTTTVICSLLMIIAGITVLVSTTLAFRLVGIVILIYAVLDIISRAIFIKEVQDYLD